MGNKASRWLRNYDAERRAIKLLSRRGDSTAEPDRAPRYAAEQQAQRQVAADPVLEAAVKERNSSLLDRLTRVKVVSSSPATSAAGPATTKSDRPLPQRRHFVPMGNLGVPDMASETVPAGRLTLAQFQELLNTREPVGGRLTSTVAEELLAFYAPLVQRSHAELRQMMGNREAAEASTVEADGVEVEVDKDRPAQKKY